MKTMKYKIIVSLLVVVSVGATVHFYLLDGLDGWFWSRGFVEDTQYSAGYSDSGFRRVRGSMDEGQVKRLIGEPLREVWWYESEIELVIEGGALTSIGGRDGNKRGRSLTAGMTAEVVEASLGKPTKKRWVFSRSANGNSYRTRIVGFLGSHVSEKIHYFDID
jgi:hypothetical protein